MTSIEDNLNWKYVKYINLTLAGKLNLSWLFQNEG